MEMKYDQRRMSFPRPRDRRPFLVDLPGIMLIDLFTVGGGTAGSVLAARLSEVGDWRILLLEAGGEQSSKVKVPWFHLWLTNTPHDWKYVTETQTNALWAFDQQVRKSYKLEIPCIFVSP
jgi:hypothetical protein